MKSDIPGYNWPFLTFFDFTIIFHLKNYLPCLAWCHYFSAQPHKTLQLFFNFGILY